MQGGHKQDENIMVCPITQGDHKKLNRQITTAKSFCDLEHRVLLWILKHLKRPRGRSMGPSCPWPVKLLYTLRGGVEEHAVGRRGTAHGCHHLCCIFFINNYCNCSVLLSLLTSTWWCSSANSIVERDRAAPASADRPYRAGRH